MKFRLPGFLTSLMPKEKKRHARRFSHRLGIGAAAEILEDRCLLATFMVSDDPGASGQDVIVNGGFETGDFTGWTVQNFGTGGLWTINDGMFDPNGPANPQPAISGRFDAVSESLGMDFTILSQEFMVPNSVNSATLRFSDRIQNFSGIDAQFSVGLYDSGALIREVFRTNPSDPLIQNGPNNRSFDVSLDLSPFEGQLVELQFLVDAFLPPLNVSVDDVSLVFSDTFTNAQTAIDMAAPGDTIMISGGPDGVLTTPEIVVDKNVTIQGVPGGPQVIVQAAPFRNSATNRVFQITPEANVTIDNLTIRHGNVPGAVFGQGGGGILNRGALTLSNSTVMRNDSGLNGGGLENTGALTLMNSTVMQNRSANHGAGISTFGGPVTLANTTVSQNFATTRGGGVYFGSGAMSLQSSTITRSTADEGGGLFVVIGQVGLESTIIAGNFSLTPNGFSANPNSLTVFRPFADDIVGRVTSAFNTLIGDAATSGGIVDRQNGNIVGNNGSGTLNLKQILDPFAKDNGGPTPTHALLPGSLAINAGSNPLNLPFDQRGPGFPRTKRGRPDIGAFETNNDLTLDPALVFGTGGNARAEIRTLNISLSQVGRIFPYDNFAGEVRVALGDVNGDEVPDIITAPGPGAGPHVKVFDGINGQQLNHSVGNFMAYDSRFTGGVYLAVADLNNDGNADIITGAGPGGGPNVRVWSGADGSMLFDFFAYDPGFTGGVRVAAGNISADNRPDIITGAGPGASPHVRVFDGTDPASAAAGLNIGGPFGSFLAYPESYTGGVFVAANNRDFLKPPVIVTSTDQTMGGPATLTLFTQPRFGGTLSPMPFDLPNFRGARIAVLDFNRDGIDDYLTASGPGSRGQVFLFSGATDDPVLPVGEILLSTFPFGEFYQSGLFVAGSI